RLVKALPKMAKAATDGALREAFQSHLSETEGHVSKVEEVFAACDAKAKGKKCEAIAGLLEEGDDIASENKGSPTINAALISAAQKMENYEIASYGTLCEWAKLLDNSAASELLGQILEEEKAADAALTNLARSRSNESAMAGPETTQGYQRQRSRGMHPARSPRLRVT